MKQKVLKFGGTSVGSAEALKKTIVIVRGEKDMVRVVIVSAFSGVTDELIAIGNAARSGDMGHIDRLEKLFARHQDMIREVVPKGARKSAEHDVKALFDDLRNIVRGIAFLGELSKRTLDLVMSFGERSSATIIAHAIQGKGTSCEYMDTRSYIVTDEMHGAASVDFKLTNARVKDHFRKHPVLQIATGFIGATKDGDTTTLGRGGSDYTASIIGAALDASAIEIWTDVSGVMTADPRKVPEARAVAHLTYAEAAELSYFGAKVIHPPTMQPAREKKIPIHIKNTFEPSAAGTVIDSNDATDTIAKAITTMDGIAMLTVHGSGMENVRGARGRLFASLEAKRVPVYLVTQASSQQAICVAIPQAHVEVACRALKEEFVLEMSRRRIDQISVDSGLSIVAVVGEGMRHRPGVSGRLFGSLGANRVNIVAIAQGSSELNVSTVVASRDALKALRTAHAMFFSDKPAAYLYVLGTGVIGSEVLRQLATLHEGREAHLFLSGISNSKKMLFAHAILARRAFEMLASSKLTADLSTFITEMSTAQVPNKIFVDCTASASVADRYAEILNAGISIVTPNKCSNSAPYETYKKLREIVEQTKTSFHYSTNVGAGLPVLSTLRAMRDSGDEIVKIEAVLSGTLSYVFSNFSGPSHFSDVVRNAKEKGYTEPDPRTDLSGMDVARKILILAREAGHEIELDDIEVEDLVSPAGKRAKTVEDFFSVLEKENGRYEAKKKAAEKKRAKLRYVATFEKGKARVRLEAVGQMHPFYNLSGSDNIISFTTKRYRETPLVIKGPGAGAEVTGAGIIGDILLAAAPRV